MKGFARWIMAIIIVILASGAYFLAYYLTSMVNLNTTHIPTPTTRMEGEIELKLPEPRYDSDVSIEEALFKRRSIREYTGEALKLQDVSQLLWAAQGVTNLRGFRTAPSAGALYPLEVYFVTGDVEGLTEGVYKYIPQGHNLLKIFEGDKRTDLYRAALEQDCVREGAISFVFTSVYKRTTRKYGDRGIRYVHMETGHAAQNLCLQATTLDLGVVTVGAFLDEQVKDILSLPEEEHPLYIIPVGNVH